MYRDVFVYRKTTLNYYWAAVWVHSEPSWIIRANKLACNTTRGSNNILGKLFYFLSVTFLLFYYLGLACLSILLLSSLHIIKSSFLLKILFYFQWREPVGFKLQVTFFLFNICFVEFNFLLDRKCPAEFISSSQTSTFSLNQRGIKSLLYPTFLLYFYWNA